MAQFVISHRDLYWRPDRNGYTVDLCEAGLYSELEARRIEANRRNPPDVAISLDDAIQRLRPNLEIVQKILEVHSK